MEKINEEIENKIRRSKMQNEILMTNLAMEEIDNMDDLFSTESMMDM